MLFIKVRGNVSYRYKSCKTVCAFSVSGSETDNISKIIRYRKPVNKRNKQFYQKLNWKQCSHFCVKFIEVYKIKWSWGMKEVRISWTCSSNELQKTGLIILMENYPESENLNKEKANGGILLAVYFPIRQLLSVSFITVVHNCVFLLPIKLPRYRFHIIKTFPLPCQDHRVIIPTATATHLNCSHRHVCSIDDRTVNITKMRGS
jgi:hypothetical protein